MRDRFTTPVADNHASLASPTPHASLFTLSFLCGLIFLATQDLQPFPGSVVIKGLSVSALALLAFLALRGADRRLLGASLAFASLGDVLLDLDPQRLFVFGLGSFLVAHLLYVGLFLRHRPRPFRAAGWRWALVLLLAGFAAGMTAWLLPGLGELAAPVVVYIGVITTMCATAALARFSNPWVLTGALLFLFSDAVIGVNRFKTAVPLAGYLVWSTYYFGQLLIVAGFLRHIRRTEVEG